VTNKGIKLFPVCRCRNLVAKNRMRNEGGVAWYRKHGIQCQLYHFGVGSEVTNGTVGAYDHEHVKESKIGSLQCIEGVESLSAGGFLGFALFVSSKGYQAGLLEFFVLVVVVVP